MSLDVIGIDWVIASCGSGNCLAAGWRVAEVPLALTYTRQVEMSATSEADIEGMLGGMMVSP
jgi:hypothetical protein